MKRKSQKPKSKKSAPSTAQLSPSAVPKSLIRFDRKTLTLLSTLLSCFIILTIFRVNGSSVGCWNSYIQKPLTSDAIFGTPKPIRSDEYVVHTPAVLSQCNSKEPFSTENYSLGGYKTPLVMNVPVRHFSTLFRPQFWLFFISGIETAFSFYWNMKFIFVIGGVFFLLMVLLDNNFILSLFGAFWVFFSGYVQWWYSTPQLLPEMIGCFALCTAALVCMLVSRNKAEIIVSCIVFGACSINFVLFLYPPCQVPLVYLSAALVIGVLLREPRMFLDKCVKDRFRWVCIGATIFTVVALLIVLYLEARETLQVLSNTVYPGQRRSPGGELSLLQMFNGFIGPLMSEDHFPRMWGNVCESANFFLFFPIPMAFLCYRLWKREIASVLEVVIAIFVVILLVWSFIGFPGLLRKYTLFDRVPGGRLSLTLGLASVIWTCVFLKGIVRDGWRIGLKIRTMVSAAAVFAICLYIFQFNKVSGNFLPLYEATVLSAFIAVCAFFLTSAQPSIFIVLILVPNIVFHSLVNPVCSGLKPIVENPVYQRVRTIVEDDPDGKWIVYAPVYAPLHWPNLVYAAGAKVFSGVKRVPNLNEMKVLSSESGDVEIYNRFAYISVLPPTGPDIRFKKGGTQDTYSIFVDPLDERWKRLDITYCASVYPFRPEVVHTAVERAWYAVPFFIYKYRNAAGEMR